jgi:CheY-like chemotaxis protein
MGYLRYDMESLRPYLLLIDDDADDRNLFNAGFEGLTIPVIVEECADGQEGLTFLAACPRDRLPALIVIDFEMPFLSGADVLLHLAAVPSLASIPKVIWAHSSRHFYQCRAFGARDFFVKPSSIAEMKALAVRLLEFMLPHDA